MADHDDEKLFLRPLDAVARGQKLRKLKLRKFSCTAYLVTPLDLVTVF